MKKLAVAAFSLVATIMPAAAAFDDGMLCGSIRGEFELHQTTDKNSPVVARVTSNDRLAFDDQACSSNCGNPWPQHVAGINGKSADGWLSAPDSRYQFGPDNLLCRGHNGHDPFYLKD